MCIEGWYDLKLYNISVTVSVKLSKLLIKWIIVEHNVTLFITTMMIYKKYYVSYTSKVSLFIFKNYYMGYHQYAMN